MNLDLNCQDLFLSLEGLDADLEQGAMQGEG
jgi:hypothetical protein